MSKLKLRTPNNIFLATVKIDKVPTVVAIKDYTGQKLRK